VSKPNIFRAILDWLAMRPVYLAYRLIWLVALTGHSDARAVYRVMWNAELDLPKIASLTPERNG
jgi:hypothetical protein